MNAWDIERIKEIMKERGLKASDFYRDDNYGTDTQFARITKTRFHRVLNGDIKHTGDDFIPTFCKIAGITEEEFYKTQKTPDELTYFLNDDEQQIILSIREIRKKSGDDHIYAYVKSFLQGLTKDI